MVKKKGKKTNSPQFKDLKRLQQEDQIISQLLGKIRLSLNINHIFTTTCEDIRKFLTVDRVAIYCFNQDWSGEFLIDVFGQGWKSLIHQQMEYSNIKKNISDCTLKYLSLTDSYLQENKGEIFTDKKLFRVCNNIYQAGFSPCYIEVLEKYQAQAYIIVPLYQGNLLWGLLAVYQNSGPRNWSEKDINFLVKIADFFNLALRQDYLLQQTQQQKSELKITLDQQLKIRAEELAREAEKERALSHVIEKIRQTLDLETIFNTATREIRQLLNADRVGIFRFQPDSNYYEGMFVSESVLSPFLSVLKQPVIDRCFGDHYATNYQKGQILLINDIFHANLSDCHFRILDRFQIRANLVLPLSKNQELWGLLCIHQCASPRQWQTDEIEFLQKISVQLGVALQQAELLQRTELKAKALQEALKTVQEQKEQQATIAQQERTISRIVDSIRQTLDIDTVFKVTTREILQTLKCDRVVVYRFFPDWNGEFVYESSTEGWIPLVVANTTTVWRDTYFQETNGGRYANHETFAVDDIYTVGHTDCHLELLELFQIRGYMVAPVFVGDKLWGLLAAYQNTGPRHWLDREINLLARIGDQLGVAVQQAQLLTQLREAMEKAKAANHAKSQFLANMSHELRTPLNAILGFTQLLENDDSLNEQQQEFIGIIWRSGRHLLNLLNDVLEMSKIEAGKITLNENEFDLYKLLSTLEEIFILKAQSKQLQLTFFCAENVPRFIKTDESKLRQVLINLISNGIKFTDSGYVILRVNCVDNNNSKYCLNFEVEDTGVGIHPEELDILFEPFYQSESGRKSQEGTGLGLPISQEFVQLMGGKIQVTSKNNQGTKIGFNIPVSIGTDNQLYQENKRKIIGLTPENKRYKILIADDKWESRLILKKMFSPLKCEIKEAENGEETIKIWEEWQPDLIWMDIRMPKLSGYEATQIIRKKEKLTSEKKIIIIALTASVFDTEKATLFSAGFNDFIAKPFQEKIIFDKMEQYLSIKYLYEKENNQTKISNLERNNDSNIKNIEKQLQSMSSHWLNQIQKAVLGARENQIKLLLQEIPLEYSLLKITLTNLLNELNFEEIVTLIENSYNHK